MYAFANNRQSCYMDSVLVCMFAPADCFDFMVANPLHSNAAVMSALQVEVDRLQAGGHRSSWVLGRFRHLMGAPWNTDSSQSAVDFFHALLDAGGVKHLGTQTRVTTHTPRDTQKRREVAVVHEDPFRVHTVIAGYHKSLRDAFSNTEYAPPASKYFSITSSIELDVPDVLVFEVGRNDSTHSMRYGDKMRINDGHNYVLCGVVCRVDSHYVAYVWMGGWYFYDDLVGALLRSEHPETRKIAPSRYGELFFYYYDV